MIENMREYKYACKEFLSGFALNALRSYGREIGVSNPTKDKKKNVLIDEIVAVLAGEVMPMMPSTRGAPVKNDFVDPKIQEGIKQIRKAHVKMGSWEDTMDRLREIEEHPFLFKVSDSASSSPKDSTLNEIYDGQLTTINGVAVLFPLDCIDYDCNVVIPVELVNAVYSCPMSIFAFY